MPTEPLATVPIHTRILDSKGARPDQVQPKRLYGHHRGLQGQAPQMVCNAYRGETVKAFLVLKEGYEGEVSEEELKAFARERLAAYKVPKLWEFRKELPKTAVGKILRRRLREE